MRRRVGGHHAIAFHAGKKAPVDRIRSMVFLCAYESASYLGVLKVREGRGATYLGVSSDECHSPKEDSRELHIGVCTRGVPSLSPLILPSSMTPRTLARI